MDELNVIGREEVLAAAETLRQYKQDKTALEQRIIAGEEWFRMRHGRAGDKDDPRPASAWLFNAVANKHADAMDNFPEAAVLPREEGDAEAAEAIEAILPAILENNGYEEVYSDKWWKKLKHGTGVEGVFWNPDKGGMGDIEIKNVDILNLYWEPGVRDIEDSKNLFFVELMEDGLLLQTYPEMEGKTGGKLFENARYAYGSGGTEGKTAVVDWYYKKAGQLHYCRFASDVVLYASENDPDYAEEGFYRHGSYPFVFDQLYKDEAAPAGFSLVDVLKDAQEYVDRLSGAVLKSALMASKKRFFIRTDGSVNEAEFADWDKDFIHVFGGTLGEDSIREIRVNPPSEIYLAMLDRKIEEMKETSGNRDFSTGGTTGGVTAASAIAALQEAGSKMSRDMIKGSYRAFSRVCRLIIELMRQFYDMPRCFRVLGGGFAWFDSEELFREDSRVLGVAIEESAPIFDISVKPQKQSPYSRISQNELAREFYQLGFFKRENAEAALLCMSMMDFDGKTRIMSEIEKNALSPEDAELYWMGERK